MSNQNKALMTHYAEGAIISRELEKIMHDSAAEARFERELVDDLELYTARKDVLIHKGNPED